MGGEAGIPDWDLKQLEVIYEDPSCWQLVIAGPGAGKSAVACQRIASLIDDGIPPTRILLVSFTRTAVAELRERISAYALAKETAKGTRISTLDSHAWRLRDQFEEEPFRKKLGEDSYDLSIAEATDLFRAKQPELVDYMERLEHLIIDEAQDIVGVRASLVIEMLKSLSEECGVTILADPNQAIYGHTADDAAIESDARTVLERLEPECPKKFLVRELTKIYRTKNDPILKAFEKTRKTIDSGGTTADLQEIIRDVATESLGGATFESIASFLASSDADLMALFRTRAEVITVSSYCSAAGIDHRLRMSGLPTVARPWIGWLFGATSTAILGRDSFDELWEERAHVEEAPFVGEQRDDCWRLCHQYAAGTRSNTIDLVQLRRILARPRPPVEFCFPELGNAGPILSTIHASKGRESDRVVLVIPSTSRRSNEESDAAAIAEEARVYYVAATRARSALAVADAKVGPVGYLGSRRIYRRVRDNGAQLEIGRQGDINRVAHLGWTDAVDIQRLLASCVNRTTPVLASTRPELGFRTRLVMEHLEADSVTRYIDIGEMSEQFRNDVFDLLGKIDSRRTLRPALSIRNLYLVSVGTLGLNENEMSSTQPPINRSGFALWPVVKGYSVQNFQRKRGTGATR